MENHSVESKDKSEEEQTVERTQAADLCGVTVESVVELRLSDPSITASLQSGRSDVMRFLVQYLCCRPAPLTLLLPGITACLLP